MKLFIILISLMLMSCKEDDSSSSIAPSEEQAPGQELENEEVVDFSYLIISVDAEALTSRQEVDHVDHVDRLIYGQFPDGRAGISEMMNAADEEGVKLTMYLDVLSSLYYTDNSIQEIALDIHSRGHDLQVHAHTPMSWKVLQNLGVENRLARDWTDTDADIVFQEIDYFFDGIGLETPKSYRAGALMYNKSTFLAMKKHGYLVSSNYNWPYNDTRQPNNWGYSTQFSWDNGIVELPIGYPIKSCEGGPRSRSGLTSNFFLSDNSLDWDGVRNASKCYGGVSMLLMHSWSLLERKDNYFAYKDEHKLEKFREFLKDIPDDIKIITMKDFINLVNNGQIKVGDTVELNRLD